MCLEAEPTDAELQAWLDQQRPSLAVVAAKCGAFDAERIRASLISAMRRDQQRLELGESRLIESTKVRYKEVVRARLIALWGGE